MRRVNTLFHKVSRIVSSFTSLLKRYRWVLTYRVEVFLPRDSVTVSPKLRTIWFYLKVKPVAIDELYCFVIYFSLANFDIG